MWKWLFDMIVEAGHLPRSYSGRGMYGKECLGVSLCQNKSQLSFAADLLCAVDDSCEDYGALVEALHGARWDTLGLGTIVYFPSVPWVENEEEEEESGLCYQCGGSGGGEDVELYCGICGGTGRAWWAGRRGDREPEE